MYEVYKFDDYICVEFAGSSVSQTSDYRKQRALFVAWWASEDYSMTDNIVFNVTAEEVAKFARAWKDKFDFKPDNLVEILE